MSIKSTSKIAKGVGKNFIEKFQKSLPLSQKLHSINTPKSVINDYERIRLKDFMEIIKDDKTKPGQELKNELEKMRSLSYVNEIVSKPEKRILKKEDYYSRADEINKKFAIKPVEPAKNSVRTGLLGYKVGMTVAWDKFGIQFPLTVIKIDNCQVTQVKTVETDKCNALQLGVGHREPKNLTKAMIGHFIKYNISPKRDVKQFRVTPENTLPSGYMLTARHFVPGQYVDIVAKSKGRGTQGVMYRWNFKGLFATHGCSIKHRAAVSKKIKIILI
jgi:50S ribosomal protein uL3